MKIAWLFPGQGSQKLGMSDNVIDLPGANKRFELFSSILNRDLLDICCNETLKDDLNSNLNNTKNTQPALFVIESLLVDALKEQGRRPAVVAGHSLGEITALYTSEIISLEDCFNLINLRSQLMAQVSNGAMAAIMGFNSSEIISYVESTNDLFIANNNSDTQIVLSGTKESIDIASKNVNCKRFIPLNVSGAFHSPFMKSASDKFNLYLDSIQFKKPIIPIISNSLPELTSDTSQIKENFKKQMCNGVKWKETMDVLESIDIKTFVEIGPGNVLAGLAKRYLKNINIVNIQSKDDLGY